MIRYLAGPALAITLWAVSLRGVNLADMGDLGLTARLPGTFYLSILLLTLSFVSVLQGARLRWWAVALHLAAAVLILHGTTALLYQVPRYSWVYKHIGATGYVLSHGFINAKYVPTDANLGWPGFFGLAALILRSAGLHSALHVALWAQLFFNGLYLIAVWFLLGGLTENPRTIALALWFFTSTNWVGQDYYAPQAFAFALYLFGMGLLLRYLVPSVLPRGSWRRRLSDAALPTVAARPQAQWALVFALLIFGAIVVSHQLTPYMMIAGYGACIAVARPKLLPLVGIMLVLAIAWTVFGAGTWMAHNMGQLATFGHPIENVESSLASLSPLPWPRRVVTLVPRVLSALVWGLGGLGAVLQWRRTRRATLAPILAAVPFVFLIAPYGGEMQFRVYLFALPWMAYLAAEAFVKLTRWLTPRLRGVTVTCLCLVLLSGYLVSDFSNESMNYMTPSDVSLAEYLYRNAPAGSFFLGTSFNYPTRLLPDYDQYQAFSLTWLPQFRYTSITAADLPWIIAFMRQNLDRGRAYFVFTDTASRQIYLQRVLRPGSVGALERAVEASDQFRLVYANSAGKVFELSSGAGP